MFITIEGIDGVGKTTQAHLLAERLQAEGYAVVVTREPGGTTFGEEVRSLLNRHADLDPDVQAQFFLASIASKLRRWIRPALARGVIVISDRFVDSTLVYQGYGAGLGFDAIYAVMQQLRIDLVPDLTLLLDADPADVRYRQGVPQMRERATTTGGDLRAGYFELIAHDPARWRIVPGTLSVSDVHERVYREVEAALKANHQVGC